jgi:hypothetical protein
MKRGRGVSGRALFALRALTHATDGRLRRRHYRRPPRPKHTRTEDRVEKETTVALAPTLEELHATVQALLEAAPHTLEGLGELIEALERYKEALTETLGTMWMQRQQGTLPLEDYPRYLYLEAQVRVAYQHLERLQPELTFAEAAFKVTTGKAHHDSYCEPVTEDGERVVQTWAAFVEACAILVERIDTQISPLVLLTKPNQEPMFELASGSETLHNMLSQVPGQVLLAQTVMPRCPHDLAEVGLTQQCIRGT